MITREIDRTEWQVFFDNFSKHHPGTAGTVQVIGPDLGILDEVSDLPFSGLSYDDKGSGSNTITLFLGSESNDHVEHRIDEPTHVWFHAGADSTSDAFDIEAADGSKTILTLRSYLAIPA